MIASMAWSLNIEEPLTSGIPDVLSMLRPASEADYRKVEAEVPSGAVKPRLDALRAHGRDCGLTLA